jgi:hypothetical protein
MSDKQSKGTRTQQIILIAVLSIAGIAGLASFLTAEPAPQHTNQTTSPF